MKRLTYVVITPVRDEADYIGKTISSMAGQTILPARWVIVDDGLSDTTPQILTAAARQYSWIGTSTGRIADFENQAAELSRLSMMATPPTTGEISISW